MTTTAANYLLPAELGGTILDRILAARLPEVEEAKRKLPAESLRMAINRAPRIRSLRANLMRRPGIIAEIKRSSPTAGVLRAGFDPVAIAGEYRKGGASAISVVTEANFFGGDLESLAGLRWQTDLPLLRKDFIVDAYQILEARHAGADAVLLIAALLDGPALEGLRRCAEELGMDALVEVRSERELQRALAAGSSVIGVNSRDLRTFEVSLETSLRLASGLPGGVLAIAESGISSADDIRRLARAGYRGFLVGTALMRSPSPGAALAKLTAALGRAA
jgi:indole-3-glycerol phosphate synthase